ncbi:hypothetical protein [Kingella potus]|uniref:hypothetical protein n=1 Tax=Kingella potus TaxID=265175 RepID=UPI001FD29F98|nr:hypothetical protein [Kingella potus]UOP01667.1 hypothetical protein LVJ84_05855 [Kingella potus]
MWHSHARVLQNTNRPSENANYGFQTAFLILIGKQAIADDKRVRRRGDTPYGCRSRVHAAWTAVPSPAAGRNKQAV